MLILKDRFDVIHNFLLVDSHTHLKINALEGLVPSEFVRKYSKAVRDLALRINEDPDQFRFQFPWGLDDKSTDYYDYCQRDIFSIVHNGKDLIRSLDRYLGFDFFVTFSSNMTSRNPRDYRSSNSKIREALVEKSITDHTPHNNFRFIGYGRLDPNHSDALDAFDNVFQLGLRGLKLHPKEENFEIDSQMTVDVLKRAAHYNMPVIFHTQEGMARRVADAVSSTLKDFIDAKRYDMLTRLKVILGHAPWNGVSNRELYSILSHPNIFGELSTLKPESFVEFFENSKSQILYDNIFNSQHISDVNKDEIEERYYRAFGYNRLNYWSSKLLFGSDTPYPPSHSAPKLLEHLFSSEFIGNASDIQNIMGVSQLKLIPPLAKPNHEVLRDRPATKVNFHHSQLELRKKESKALGVDPVFDVYPTVKVNGAIFSFLRDGERRSWLFKSLFYGKKPYNMVVPNPHDLSESPIISTTTGMTKEIELSLGKG